MIVGEMTTVMEKQEQTHVDIEQQQQQEISNKGRSSSSSAAAAAYEESDGGVSDGSLCFSDAEDHRSWHSPYNGGGGGGGGGSVPEINKVVPHSSKVVVVVDNSSKDCRICHLSLDSSNPESSGIPIELGCSCKEDLAAAHKHCAEAWFKIKGNKTCEICGSVARNVVGVNETEFMDQWNETSTTAATPAPATETRSFWHGHRFLNFLLACMVFAFVISWLFHFNVPS